MAYRTLFNNLGHEIVEDINDAELLCFTGGADVSPELYGESKHPHTSTNPQRDEDEQVFYKFALNKRIPMVGICRGAQFLHVMNGCKLWQHVDHHAIGGTHEATDEQTGDVVHVTSTHHQMMSYDFGVGELVCTAKESVRKENMRYGKLNSVLSHIDVEVVWHGNTKCLCFQPHPELRGADSTYLYFKNLMERYYE
jgi:carbamoylphosphate synthase small subunit